MFKYYCLNPIAAVGLDNFNDQYEKTEDINEADVILVRSADMHSMEFSDNLKAVVRAGAGVNNIPLEDLAKKGVVVFNTPGANANAVKELVICGMLLACRDVIGGVNWVKSQAGVESVAKDAEKEKKKFAGTEVYGKKLGIIGLGAIGVKVANTARHLGMEVYGYDPYLSVNAAWNLSRDVKHVTDVKDIYKECDFITVHVPALDSTKGMINEEAISMMKDGVIILNYARDILCDEQAILKGIESGKIRRYVSDFANTVTAGKEGCIVTPHLGASTEESEDNCAVMGVNEVMDFMENGNIKNSVNYPGIDMGVPELPGRVAVYHKNIANTITKLAGMFGENNINISHMSNQSKKDYAVSMFDIDSPATDEIVKGLESVEGVFTVRVVK
ncbi:MAG TPA: 3-phosphoglycerate dehydrogenase [Lachnospiraceae bacterium]|nr:3-phosphoglycerate dehydrogenase [Lachnospiraceae bacterium]